MSEEAKVLTPEDPISPETLETFKSLRDTWAKVAESLARLKLEESRLLAILRTLDGQRDLLFERCNIERGLPPNSVVEIDSETGKITVVHAEGTQG